MTVTLRLAVAIPLWTSSLTCIVTVICICMPEPDCGCCHCQTWCCTVAGPAETPSGLTAGVSWSGEGTLGSTMWRWRTKFESRRFLKMKICPRKLIMVCSVQLHSFKNVTNTLFKRHRGILCKNPF